MDRSVYTAIEKCDIKAGDLVGFIEAGCVGLIANGKCRYAGEHDRYYDVLVVGDDSGHPAVYSICDLDFMIIDDPKSFALYTKAVKEVVIRRQKENRMHL